MAAACGPLPERKAKMLADLVQDFFSQPGMEEKYQAWMAEQAAERKAKRQAKKKQVHVEQGGNK